MTTLDKETHAVSLIRIRNHLKETMGSLGTLHSDPYSIQFHLTGFSRFGNISENPTETVVKKFPTYCESRGGLGACASIVSSSVSVTSVNGASQVLEDVYTHKLQRGNNIRSLVIHCGVDASATCFHLEERAYNEATFSCPDESGWQPRHASIDADKPLDSFLMTSLDTKTIALRLEKQHFTVKCSQDAGRFLCNWIYYKSLQRAQKEKHAQVLFVHFPPCHDEEKLGMYLEFLYQLLNILTEMQ
eukprot:jgi/Galph1/3139/GphlegSOOS_G1812.1